ncbi:MAG: ATP-dependent Clp protease ATP-binding subunit [Bacilli bacterium]|nr:ATP-dependent Clp protease ATP-binding subunit [Bacilli bacterium]
MQEVETLDFDNTFSILDNYGENLTDKVYNTNPAIAREEEIKRLTIILLTPDKSALLVGKAGIGKTAIVEGLAYKIKNNTVPDVLKGYKIYKISATSLLGKINTNGREELVISKLLKELQNKSNIIVFIDEIHTLMGGANDGPLDLANILKPALDRGSIKLVGATTEEEYLTYVIKDRAFLRRFDKIDVSEPSRDTTIDILEKSLPRYEAQTGIKFKYNHYITHLLIESIVDATSEFKRVYGLSAMYPDIAFSILSQAFSNALYENKKEVDVIDVYNAIRHSKRIYPDSVYKELIQFKNKFKDLCEEENIYLEDVKLEDIENNEENY